MTYHFPAPEHYPTDEEKKLEILKYLSDGCWLADTIHKEESNRQIAHEHDHVAFFIENNPFFDYPEAAIINELVTDGLLSVHVEPWVSGGMANPHYNLRYFRLTDLGRQYYASRGGQATGSAE
jgi:hypothetical protein